MKALTMMGMAAARLRANKRGYRSLVLGIFLSVFMVSTLVLSVYGIYQAELEKRYDKVGGLDMVMLDNAFATEADLQSFDEIDRVGHAYISGVVTGRNVYVGFYDEVGLSLLNLEPLEGRLPQQSGEIALERSALEILDVPWQLGETVALSITPVDGTEEVRSFTVVGILPERTIHLGVSDQSGLNQFPAIVTSSREPAFSVGRLGVHYLMGLKKTATLNTALRSFYKKIQGSGTFEKFYALSTTGKQQVVSGLGNTLDVDQEMFTLIGLAVVLALSLILSAGIGISGAMEGVLSKRREEIGVLRALGATRRQIRRMYGRENLILAAVTAPLSIAMSCLAVWVLSLLLPQSVKFVFRLWLIAPIAVFSAVVILLSGYLPLVRASKLMPMSVIRDTAMLRRGKGIRSKKVFSPAKLISARQLRFHPTRQIGASLLVGLMLLCSGLLAGFIVSYQDYTALETPGFFVRGDMGWIYNNHVGFSPNPSLSKQSIAQIRSLPHVESVELERQMTVTMLLEQVPRYAVLDRDIAQYGMLDDDMFEAAMVLNEEQRNFYENLRKDQRARYLQFRKDFSLPGEAFDVVITTVELNAKNLDRLKPYLESGAIHVDAINAGKEVLLVAPQIWIKRDGNGGTRFWYSEAAVKKDPAAEGAVLAAWNDAFTAGQALPLLQLYRTEEEGPVKRIDVNTTVGAVLSQDAGITNSFSLPCIITTEQGLENMGLLMEGLREIGVRLDGELTAREEETLERQLNAIARRSAGYTVFNQMEQYREMERENQQKILLFTAMVIVFFSVAVGMIVSSVTRQLHAEGRTIGMLRAVGADEKAILGCYGGQVNASVAGGLGISLGLMLLFLIASLIDMLLYRRHYFAFEGRIYLLIVSTICVMGAICFLACKFLLRFRIRELVNRSIIDNIREL